MPHSRITSTTCALAFAGSILISPATAPSALAGSTNGQAPRIATSEAPYDAVVAWTYYAPSPRTNGDPSWFDATFDSTETPAFGTLQVRDTTTGTILGSTPVTSTHAVLDTGFVMLALGSHDIVAEFVGDPGFVQASVGVTIDVVPDTVVQANVFPLNLTTFYPLADGYRNRLRIWGQCAEYSGCSPKVEIYTDTDRIVRRWILPEITQGQYALSWDGRTAIGTMLQAGRYRIHHAIRDWAGNVLVVDQWVTLSHRTVRWVNVSVTWAANTYTFADTGYSGWISRGASSYAGGVKLGVKGSGGGWANIGFRHRLQTGLAFRSMYVRALGRSLTSGNEAMAWCSPQSQAVLFTTTYQWYSTPVNSACWPNGVAHPMITISGIHTATVDIAKVRITYAYAVWAT